MSKNLNRAVFRYVEHELYNYENTKKELEAIREDIREKMPSTDDQQERVQSSRISKPTEEKGVNLLTNTAIVRMSKTVEAIDTALQRLNDDHYILFQTKYCEGKGWQACVQELPTSERSYSRKRKELVEMVALQMGMISELYYE